MGRGGGAGGGGGGARPNESDADEGREELLVVPREQADGGAARGEETLEPCAGQRDCDALLVFGADGLSQQAYREEDPEDPQQRHQPDLPIQRGGGQNLDDAVGRRRADGLGGRRVAASHRPCETLRVAAVVR